MKEQLQAQLVLVEAQKALADFDAQTKATRLGLSQAVEDTQKVINDGILDSKISKLQNDIATIDIQPLPPITPPIV